MRTSLASIFILVTGFSAGACESARVQFEGTAFASTALQIENDNIYFFRGAKNELSIGYSPSRNMWCYVEAEPSAPLLPAKINHPRNGCLERKVSGGKRMLLIDGKPTKIFVLKDLEQKPVATINVVGKVMTANLLGGDGKALGKRIVFKSVTKGVTEMLEVRGWNCPNPRFLSCVGSDLTAALDSEIEAEAESPRLAVADLGKRLGHYRFSCAGIHERAVDGSGETQRAPAFAEPIDY